MAEFVREKNQAATRWALCRPVENLCKKILSKFILRIVMWWTYLDNFGFKLDFLGSLGLRFVYTEIIQFTTFEIPVFKVWKKVW